MQRQLINFLNGTGKDDRGRTIMEIIKWPDGQLESCHDYIQWVFPNRSQSSYNPNAPTPDDETAAHVRSSPEAINYVRAMLKRLFTFYGFKVVSFDDGTYQLDLLQENQRPWWITPDNHNFLRLTRIMKTLRQLELQEDLYALADILDILGHKYRPIIGEKTLRFWEDACH